MNQTLFDSPLGPLTLAGDDAGLHRLYFPGGAPAHARPNDHCAPLRAAAEQLKAYFAGELKVFDVPLALTGTPFQRQVWEALQRIPYGATTSYGALAGELAVKLARDRLEPRAVAGAIARTPVPILVPCHRVVGANGSLTGYGGGLHRKRALLEFEGSGGVPGALATGQLPRQLALI
jgi:methylated-DNA-[protein]-cysteine S-methyltransferase